MERTAITPRRDENYPEWYQQVVSAADLAENSPVRGCMVIKPWGYALWEAIQKDLDARFKATGHVNAYFPLLIPLSYLSKEAEHVEGFAKECAVVTHHRLAHNSDGQLVPEGPLEEPLVIRPTSETIIGEMYARWVQSYRDLPILINQWANVMRWEMRTRLFLRTSEFLWQEGHTAHATAQEAVEETHQMLNVYADFAEQVLAMPVIKGEKTVTERFPGAVNTYCIEAMMQDRKALQAGTSHFLGQNFSRSSKIQFLSAQGQQEFAWTTSWGVSTRLIGGVIMTHSDDDGLVLPPRIAPYHVVILPIYRSESDRLTVLEYCRALQRSLSEQIYAKEAIRVHIDSRELQGGEKMWQWVKKGVPVRLEVGPRDVAQNAAMLARRDHPVKQKQSVSREGLVGSMASILEEIQSNLLARATQLRQSHLREFSNRQEFEAFFTPHNIDNPEIHGGFAVAYAVDDEKLDEFVKPLKVTARCIPLLNNDTPGVCLFTGRRADRKIIFAKSY